MNKVLNVTALGLPMDRFLRQAFDKEGLQRSEEMQVTRTCSKTLANWDRRVLTFVNNM